jgi:hypothetical protein
VGRLSIAVLAIVLVLPLCFGYSIEQASIEWNGHTVRTLAPGKSLSDVVLSVRLSSDFRECINGTLRSKQCQVQISAPTLSPQLERVLFDVRTHCSANLTCRSAPFTFRITNATNSLQYFTVVDTARSSITATPLTFTIDSTTPQVVSIETGYCSQGICYASNRETPVKITFSDSVTAFDYRLVFIGPTTSQSPLRVQSCSDRICSGVVTLPCSRDGEEFTLQLRDLAGVPSMEDAQNPAPAATQKVICKLQAPRILELQGVGDGVAGLRVRDGAVTYTAKVSGFGQLIATAALNTSNTTMNFTGSCTADVCTWKINPLPESYVSVQLKISDAIGNLATRQESFRVLNISSSQSSADFALGTMKVTPDALNRMALDLARANFMPYPAYVTYTLSRKNPQARILRQELKSCAYKLPNETNYTQSYNLFSFGGAPKESRVLYPDYDFDRTNRLNLQIRADRAILARSDRFDVRCQLDVIPAVGNTVYTSAQSINITFRITLRDAPLGQPGEAFVKKIQEEEKKQNSGYVKTIRSLEQMRQRMDQMCQGIETLQMIKSVGSTVQGVGHGFCTAGITKPIGDTLNQVGGNVFGSASPIVSKLWEGAAPDVAGSSGSFGTLTNPLTSGLKAQNFGLNTNGGPIRTLCRQVNCRVYADIKDDKAFIGEGSFSKFDNYVKGTVTANTNAADPQASLVGAVSTMCFGGVIYNLQKYNTVGCNYLQCLKDQSLKGSSVAVCDQSKSFQMCQNVMGEFSELPYARVYKNLLQNIHGIVSTSPMFVSKYYLAKQCGNYLAKQSSASVGSAVACPDWFLVACRVKDSLFGLFDVRQQSNPAFLGIRDSNLKSNLELCMVATKNPSRTTSSADMLSAVSRFGAMSRDVLAQHRIPVERNVQDTVEGALKTAGVATDTVTKRIPASEMTKVVDSIRRTDDGKKVIATINSKIVELPISPDKIEQAKTALHPDVIAATRDGMYFEQLYERAEGKLVPKQGGTIIEQAQEYKRIKEEAIKYLDPNKRKELLEAYDKQIKTATDAMNAATSVPAYQQLEKQRADAQEQVNKLLFRRDDADLAKAKLNAQLSEEYVKYDSISSVLESLPPDTPQYAAKRQELAASQERLNTISSEISKRSQESSDALAQATKLAADVTKAEQALASSPQGQAKAKAEKDLQQAKEKKAREEERNAHLNEIEKLKKPEALEAAEAQLAGMPEGTERNLLAQRIQQAKDLNRADAIKKFKLAQNMASTVGLGTDYLAKWAYDKGYLNFLVLNPPGLDNLNPDQLKRSICSLQNEIVDNDDGSIFDVQQQGRVVSTFGTEIMQVQNESGTQYAYITLAYVNNPQRDPNKVNANNNYMMNISLSGLENCAGRGCPQEYVLTGAGYNLSEGTSFASGELPRTNIMYLPGKYSKVCVTFDHNFPSPSNSLSKRQYCRTIRDRIFETGKPILPESTLQQGAPASDPLRGWT